jgi:hypothetical protein
MLCCRPALEVRWPIVSSVEIDVMAVCSRLILVDLMTDIPLVGEAMRWKKAAIEWLIDHFVT